MHQWQDDKHDCTDDFDILIPDCIVDHNKMDELRSMETLETKRKSLMIILKQNFSIIQYVDQSKKLLLELDMLDKVETF